MSAHERVTFTQGREVIEHAVRHLSRVRDVLSDLREQGDHDERVALFLDSVEVEQRNLLGAMARLLDDGASKVLEAYAQYTVELPVDIDPPEDDPLTTLGLLKWLTRQNDYVGTTFAELTEKGDSEEAKRVFASIADQVEGQDKRLAKEYQRTQDM